MKKNITKKSTKVSKLPKPTVNVDLTDVDTYDDMIVELASAKVNAGYGVDVSEFMHIISNENKGINELLDAMLKVYTTQIEALINSNARLRNKLAWATRPWYKKLMFWKKNPNK